MVDSEHSTSFPDSLLYLADFPSCSDDGDVALVSFFYANLLDYALPLYLGAREAAAEAAGWDWPSSCRNGTCRTCLGHLVEGTVRYAIEWPGLTAEEKEEGCVLPCVAYPASDVVLQGSAI